MWLGWLGSLREPRLPPHHRCPLGASPGEARVPGTALGAQPTRISEFVPQSVYKGKKKKHCDKESSAGRTLGRHISQALYFYKQGEWDPERLLMVVETSNTKSGELCYAKGLVWGEWFFRSHRTEFGSLLLTSSSPPPPSCGQLLNLSEAFSLSV